MARLLTESLTPPTGVGWTVMLAKASLPRELAAIRTVPTFRPVTTPFDATSAIDASALAHEMRDCGTVSPLGSSTAAFSVRVEPTATVAVAGSTTTEPTASTAGPRASFEHAERAAAVTHRTEINARARVPDSCRK